MAPATLTAGARLVILRKTFRVSNCTTPLSRVLTTRSIPLSVTLVLHVRMLAHSNSGRCRAGILPMFLHHSVGTTANVATNERNICLILGQDDDDVSDEEM